MILDIYKINGNSMFPSYMDGDYVVTVKYRKRIIRPKPRQDAVFLSNRYGILIKRITHVDYDKKTVLTKGINKYSITAEELGEIPFDNLISTVVLKVTKRNQGNRNNF